MRETPRPDPDELLARIQEEEARAGRGLLKVFLGAAPGVGKTYAMLEAARARQQSGLDVVVGVVETHGRSDTAALLSGLESLPRRELSYRGTRLFEFDLDAALARRPGIALVDELAHTNAPGSRHSKRYRDVEELLAAGIDVYTTLNVQHLESLNDIVAQVTGVTVRETVPDAILDRADEIELVDLPVDELRRRLADGKVYLGEQGSRAAESFFRPGNLIALRELALRATAERVDRDMQRYRTAHGMGATWPTTERILVSVGASPYASRIVRAASRIATGLKAEWLVATVETPANLRLAVADRDQLQRTLRLAEELGAEVVSLAGHDAVAALLGLARRRNVTRIITGKPREPAWRELLFGSFVQRLLRESGDIDVQVITGASVQPHAPAHPAPRPRSRLRGYAFAAGVVAACTLIAALLAPRFGLANLVMIYLLGVVLVAARSGRGPAVLASVASVAAFDFFFVPPSLTLAVADTQYLVTFAVMLVVALVISSLTATVRDQGEAARVREERTAALFAVSRACAGAGESYEVVRQAMARVGETLGAEVAAFLPHRDGRVVPVWSDRASFAATEQERSVAQWVFDHRETAGAGTRTLPGSAATYLPLLTSRGSVGVIGVRTGKSSQTLAPDQLHLLQAFASQIALAVERTNLAAEAQAANLRAETERMRSSLLSSVSHDLRSPLTAIGGAAATLVAAGSELEEATRDELLGAIVSESERLERFIANLLAMTRLEAGAVEVGGHLLSLDEVVEVALRRLDTLLGGRAVTVDLEADLPPIRGDQDLLALLLANLIENAVKHAPGRDAIEVSARRTDEGASVELAVADRGPGVPAAEEERIFDKFYRVSGRTEAPGSGLGLAICRAVASAHGGSVAARNRPDGGLVVTVRLPASSDVRPAVPRTP